MSDDLDLIPMLNPPNGRDERGLFSKGNTHAKGHTGPRRTTELRNVFRDATTPEKVREVEQSLYELALGGDVAAIRVWLEHAIGKPTQAIEISGPEGKTLDVTTVAAVVLEALGDDQGARVRMAAAFAKLGKGSTDAMGGGPGAGD